MMSVAQAHAPRVRHRLRGRLRAHVPHVGLTNRQAVERRIGQLPGVRSVRANALTGNVLVHFDPSATDEGALIAHLSVTPESAEDLIPAATPTAPPPAEPERTGLLPGVMKLLGAAVSGLLLLARRLGLGTAPGGGPLVALGAGALAVLVSLPPARAALEHVLGPAGVGLVCHLTDLLANVVGGDILGLVLQALDAVLMMAQSLPQVAKASVAESYDRRGGSPFPVRRALMRL